MRANILGIMGIVLGFALFAVVYQQFRARPISFRLKWLGLFFVLGLPGMVFAAYYLHVLPETAAFYEFRSWWGTELLVVFLGGFWGMVATFIPRCVHALPLMALAGMLMAPFIKPLVGPLSDVSFHNIWSGAVCMQSTPSTCGPASVVTIMRHLGVQSSEMDVSRAAHSYLGGTEAWYLARYIRQKGLSAKFIFTKEFIPDAQLPVMAGVRLSGDGHFIPILKREGDKYLIGDPLNGEEHLTKEDLVERYRFTGFYLAVAKGNTRQATNIF